MGMRRDARERAVQFLFEYDLNPAEDYRAALEEFWHTLRLISTKDKRGNTLMEDPAESPPPTTTESAVRLFADPLIEGVVKHRVEIDALLQKYTLNWDLRRMAVVDRNVLRLATFEMLHRDDIPPVVSINEAVDIAKKFSTEDSGRFVNGILDRIKAELPQLAPRSS
jgi:N utilization substance protein B